MKTKKMLVLIGLLCLSNVSARAGWFSGFGNRIANGVVNTIQNNISGKVNRAVDNAMDGKVGNTAGKSKSKNKKTQSAASVDKSTMEDKVAETQKMTSKSKDVFYGEGGRITYTNKRGKALKYTNNYIDIDLGAGFEFKGEHLYTGSLDKGHMIKTIEEFLDPGTYLIFILARSYGEGITYQGFKDHEGIELGYGIQVKRRKLENEKGRITARTNGSIYLVEVLPNTQGYLQVGLLNSETLNEAGELTIYKVPEGPKWLK